MVGSGERGSYRASLLYLAAALLACDVAFAQPQVSVVERQHLTVQATGAHRLSLAVVQVDGTGWIRDKAEAVLREASTILAQCDIGITSVEWLRVSVPPRYLDFSTPTARELAVAAPVRRPAIYLVRNTLNRPAFQAEAIGRGNSRTRPELVDTVWITLRTRDPGIALAHELAHVLMNSGEHSDEPDNLMRDEASGANTKLSVTQCTRMRDTARENGLLQR